MLSKSSIFYYTFLAGYNNRYGIICFLLILESIFINLSFCFIINGKLQQYTLCNEILLNSNNGICFLVYARSIAIVF